MSKSHTETITFIQEELLSISYLIIPDGFINGTYRYEEGMIPDFRTLVEYNGGDGLIHK